MVSIKRAVAAAVLFLGLAAQASAQQIVFNEILYRHGGAGTHVDQVIELKNIGSSAVNVGGWILCHEFSLLSVLPTGVTILPGGLLVCHFNASGTNTATDIYFPSDALSDVSDCGLYVSGTTNFATSSGLRAFIQWGGVAVGRQSVAQSAGLWTTGTFVPGVADGHSIELCADDFRTPSSYVDQGAPTIGAQNGCGVPVQRVSWSAVKSIFR